jgi:hypothetical protein
MTRALFRILSLVGLARIDNESDKFLAILSIVFYISYNLSQCASLNEGQRLLARLS